MIFSNLPDILESGKHAYPRRPAIVFGSKIFTYEEIHEKACVVARCLKEKNIAKGDRVAILLDNSPEFVFVYFGILMTGAIVVPINHMFKREEIKYILEDSGSLLLITHAIYEKTSEELKTMVNGLKDVLYTHQITPKNTPSSTYYLAPSLTQKNDLAVFLYTSGTTGHPKAAMLTHGNLLANVASSGQAIRVTPKDAVICFLPLFHSFAATVCMLMPLSFGGRCVIMKSPRPIKKLMRAIRKNKITIFVGIPSLFNILKDIKLPGWLPPWTPKWIIPVRLAISGAAALPIEVFKKCEERFGLPLLEGYGLTEASPVVSLNPLAGPRKAGSIGKPIPGVRVKIVDEKDDELSAEAVGELCIQGPNVMRGYYKKEEENRLTIKKGWLFTGDMAKIDKDGYIYIMGRKKEMVNVRGLNVYPREIEEVLYQHPRIREAAVIGVPDPHKGEVPKGYVVLETPGALTEHEIIAYLKEHLALFKIPKRIEIRNELPKNSSGKILKRKLAEENQ